jgi:hypothetical protein
MRTTNEHWRTNRRFPRDVSASVKSRTIELLITVLDLALHHLVPHHGSCDGIVRDDEQLWEGVRAILRLLPVTQGPSDPAVRQDFELTSQGIAAVTCDPRVVEAGLKLRRFIETAGAASWEVGMQVCLRLLHCDEVAGAAGSCCTREALGMDVPESLEFFEAAYRLPEPYDSDDISSVGGAYGSDRDRSFKINLLPIGLRPVSEYDGQRYPRFHAGQLSLAACTLSDNMGSIDVDGGDEFEAAFYGPLRELDDDDDGGGGGGRDDAFLPRAPGDDLGRCTIDYRYFYMLDLYIIEPLINQLLLSFLERIPKDKQRATSRMLKRQYAHLLKSVSKHKHPQHSSISQLIMQWHKEHGRGQLKLAE